MKTIPVWSLVHDIVESQNHESIALHCVDFIFLPLLVSVMVNHERSSHHIPIF